MAPAPDAARTFRAKSVSLRAGLAATLLAVLCACASGSVNETPFVRTASGAASLLSAGAETIRFVHSEPARFTVEYGRGASINYHELLFAVPDGLAQLEGAPDQATVARLVALLQLAVADLADPCLLEDCDWESQVARIDDAKRALLEASE